MLKFFASRREWVEKSNFQSLSFFFTRSKPPFFETICLGKSSKKMTKPNNLEKWISSLIWPFDRLPKRATFNEIIQSAPKWWLNNIQSCVPLNVQIKNAENRSLSKSEGKKHVKGEIVEWRRGVVLFISTIPYRVKFKFREPTSTVYYFCLNTIVFPANSKFSTVTR